MCLCSKIFLELSQQKLKGKWIKKKNENGFCKIEIIHETEKFDFTGVLLRLG